MKPPLPYPHRRAAFAVEAPLACTVPEAGPLQQVQRSHSCPGCATHVAAQVLREPTAMAIDATSGKTRPAIEVFRELHDEFDPLRVMVERELARRA